MSNKLKILYLENVPSDAGLINRVLQESALNVECFVADNKEVYTSALKEFAPDIILSSDTVPGFAASDAMAMIKAVGLAVPFILIAHDTAEILAVEILAQGADDYIWKDRPARLPHVITSTLARLRTEREQKAFSADLLKSEKRYHALVENGADAVVILSEAGQPIYASSSVKKVLGYTVDEILASELVRFTHPDDTAELAAVMAKVLQHPGLPIKGYTGRILHKDGSWRWMEATVTNLLHDPAIGGIVDNFRDVTEKKIAEEKIFQLNRLYAFISQINQAIVQAPGEDALLKKVCRIATEVGGLAAAWIGMFNTKEEEIKMVASFGIKEEHLPAFKETGFGPGEPQDIILQTGTYFTCDNLTNGAPAEKWKMLAAEMSFGSCMVLPLRSAGRIVGSFNLYALARDFFSAPQIKLLTEAAGDISFALDYYDKENLKLAAELKTKTAEVALQKLAVNMEAILNNTSEGFIVTDTKGAIRSFNNKANSIFLLNSGKELAEDKYIFEYTHESRQEMYRMAIPEVLAGKEMYYEISFDREKGEKAWFIFTINRVGPQEAAEGFLITAKDITERKAAEEQLRDSELFNKAILASLTSHIAVVNKTGVIESVNKAWTDFATENAPTTLDRAGAGTNYFTVCGQAAAAGDSIAAEVLHGIKSVFTHPHEIFQIEYPCHSAGTERWFTLQVSVFDSSGSRVVISHQDISERKRAEEALLRSYKEKNLILESIGEAFFAVDRNWIVSYWNKEAERMLQTPREEIMGRDLWAVFSRSVDSESYRQYQEALATNEVKKFEDYFPHGEKWFEISAFPSAAGLSVFFKDITARKLSDIQLTELNRELAKQAKDLEASNKELEDFAYITSHDLQEPLRMVTGFLGQIEKNYGHHLDEKGKQYIHFAVDGAKRMRQIILDLLDFSRLSIQPETAENIDPAEIIAEILVLYRKQIKETNASIRFDKLPRVKAHKALLLQVFQNLISNALKYHRENTPPKIYIAAEKIPGYWQFIVTDEGIGIHEEFFKRIFIIFQRLHNKNEYSGTGIGLAVCKKIIENAGGMIWVTSEPDKGSSFYFTLPDNL